MVRPRKDQNNSEERRLTQIVVGNVLWRSGLAPDELETILEVGTYRAARGGDDGSRQYQVDANGRKLRTGRQIERWCGIAPGGQDNSARAANPADLKKFAEAAIRNGWLAPWEWEPVRRDRSMPLTDEGMKYPAEYFKGRKRERDSLETQLERLKIEAVKTLTMLNSLQHFVVKLTSVEAEEVRLTLSEASEEFQTHLDAHLASFDPVDLRVQLAARANIDVEDAQPDFPEPEDELWPDAFKESIEQFVKHLNDSYIHQFGHRPLFLQPRPGIDEENVLKFLKSLADKRRKKRTKYVSAEELAERADTRNRDSILRGAKAVQKWCTGESKSTKMKKADVDKTINKIK